MQNNWKLVEEEYRKEDNAYIYNGKHVMEIFNDGVTIKEPKYNKLSINTEFCDDKVELIISPDFELKQEGNKWFAVKKKNKYPKTYEGCCEILSLGEDGFLYTKGYKASLIQAFQKLLICRNAYWKIAGEQMGLGKPWEPDWTVQSFKYTIHSKRGNLIKGIGIDRNTILIFPTEEIRDTFHENFKDLIEQCKELL